MKITKTYLALCVALLLVDVTLQSDKRKIQSNPCPEGWDYAFYDRRCYLYGRLNVTWLEALGICQALDAKLVEPRQLVEMILISGGMRWKNTGAVWTGGNTFFTGDGWRWLDGNVAIGSFDSWYPPAPSKTGGNHRCLEIPDGLGYRFNEIDCNTKNTFVCEIRLVM